MARVAAIAGILIRMAEAAALRHFLLLHGRKDRELDVRATLGLNPLDSRAAAETFAAR